MGSTRSRRACNSQLLRMPQAHRRSCDKNQPISYGLSVTKHQKLSRTADHSCTWWFLYLISINISRSRTNARARNHLSFAENILFLLESSVHGCIATTDATGAQALWKEGEAVRPRLPRVFRRDMWTAPIHNSKFMLNLTFFFSDRQPYSAVNLNTEGFY